MTLTCSKFRSEQRFKKNKSSYVPKGVFYEIYKHQLCYTFYEAKSLLAMTYVCLSAPPRDIVMMSQDKSGIFDLSRISAFIKYIIHWGFPLHRSRYWSIFT